MLHHQSGSSTRHPPFTGKQKKPSSRWDESFHFRGATQMSECAHSVEYGRCGLYSLPCNGGTPAVAYWPVQAFGLQLSGPFAAFARPVLHHHRLARLARARVLAPVIALVFETDVVLILDLCKQDVKPLQADKQKGDIAVNVRSEARGHRPSRPAAAVLVGLVTVLALTGCSAADRGPEPRIRPAEVHFASPRPWMSSWRMSPSLSRPAASARRRTTKGAGTGTDHVPGQQQQQNGERRQIEENQR